MNLRTNTETGETKGGAMWVILCIRESGAVVPLMEDDDELFKIESPEEARMLAREHILCRVSEVLFVNVETGVTEWL